MASEGASPRHRGQVENLIEKLSSWTKKHPNKVLFRFINDTGKVTDTLSYKEVSIHSRAIARQLLKDDRLQRGDRILLTFMPSLEFIVSFIGCLRAGLIAVPVYPPDPRNLAKNMYMFASIQKSCDAKAILTHKLYTDLTKVGELADAARRLFTRRAEKVSWPDLPWIVVDKLLAKAMKTRRQSDRKLRSHSSSKEIGSSKSDRTNELDKIAMDDVAFLQYTSGSTSEPKGVMVTHKNLAHNLHTIAKSLNGNERTRVVSWLPQYHDMGLIGSYLGVLYSGGTGLYMSPLTFIQDPTLWIRAISKFQATHLQAPNFAYALCTRKWREARLDTHAKRPDKSRMHKDITNLQDDHIIANETYLSFDQIPTIVQEPLIDLSTVQHIFNAAEPITLSAMHGFLSHFAAYGLAPSAMKPGFGMAEHTVYVSDGGIERLRLDRDEFEKNQQVKPILRWHMFDDEKAISDAIGADPSVLLQQDTAHLIGHWEQINPESTEPLPDLLDVVGCGRIDKNPDIEIAIVARKRSAGDEPEPDQTENDKNVVKETSDETTSSENITGKSVPNGHVGEIWLRSSSVAKGYWNRHGETVATFHAQLEDETGTERTPWMCTGDLGFIYHDELFIAGRSKDMIILRGRNHFPQDIEQTVETSAPKSFRPGCCAAFSTFSTTIQAVHALLIEGAVSTNVQTSEIQHARSDNGLLSTEQERTSNTTASDGTHKTSQHDELLAVVAEIRHPDANKTELERLARETSRAILSDHGISPGIILFLKPKCVVKTTSGKIARKWNQTALDQLARGAKVGPSESSNNHLQHHNVGKRWLPSTGAVVYVWCAANIDDSAAVGFGISPEITQENEGLLTLQGPALANELQRQIGRLIGEEPSTVPVNQPLTILGLDSLELTQFNGVISRTYGLNVSQQQVFAEGCTIWWIVAHADVLRQQDMTNVTQTTSLPPPSASEGRVNDPSVQEELHASGAVEDPTALGGGKQKSKFQTFCQNNCPCCICCY